MSLYSITSSTSVSNSSRSSRPPGSTRSRRTLLLADSHTGLGGRGSRPNHKGGRGHSRTSETLDIPKATLHLPQITTTTPITAPTTTTPTPPLLKLQTRDAQWMVVYVVHNDETAKIGTTQGDITADIISQVIRNLFLTTYFNTHLTDPPLPPQSHMSPSATTPTQVQEGTFDNNIRSYYDILLVPTTAAFTNPQYQYEFFVDSLHHITSEQRNAAPLPPPNLCSAMTADPAFPLMTLRTISSKVESPSELG
eukprot:scaffold38308_cov34-Attheya_sp.AAC.3